MVKENKFKFMLSSVVILLPALFGFLMWDRLPGMLTTYWGADGNVDEVSAKLLMVLGAPVMLLAVHLFCLLFTIWDQKQRGQSKKALRIIFWINPAMSLFVNGTMYAAAWGKEFELEMLMPALLGIMFIVIGNYLPKIKQNRTLGIKVPWALNNEENWNKTHRLGGKVWVAAGALMIVSVFFPNRTMVLITVCAVIVMGIIPIVYSYWIYKKHQKEGILYTTAPRSKAEKFIARIAGVIVAISLMAVAVLMFTGDIEVYCDDTSLRIEADYWYDLKVDYSEINAIAYRKDFDPRVRTNGFGSARLLMGNFQNDEVGSYTLYAYNGAEEYLVLENGKRILVIGMKDADKTQAIYQALLEKTGKHG